MRFFRPSFRRPTESVVPARIAASLKGRPGVYVHVPFCTSICPFCPYNKVVYAAADVGPYFEALHREATGWGKAMSEPFTSLYVGGGTPTLCLEELEGVLDAVEVRGERAIEVLPTHATPHTVATLRRLGFTHVSIGAQSFDPAVLRRLGRPHTAAHTRAALANVRDAFACVDVDLIFDTAFQDVRTFLRDVETCCRAGADQISTYPLMRFGMTPLGKGRHDPRREHEALHRAEALTARYGYERHSVWTFRRRGGPTYSSITREFFVGLGAGAATFTGDLFLVNHFSVDRYVEEGLENVVPVARIAHLGPLSASAYYLFWQAYSGRVDLGRFRRFYPGDRFLEPLLYLLAAAGLLRPCAGGFTLTRKGYDLYHDLERQVTYRFIEPLWADLTREAEELESRHRTKAPGRPRPSFAPFALARTSPNATIRTRPQSKGMVPAAAGEMEDTPMKHAQGSFCWYDCATRDVAAARVFYNELFGWTGEDQPLVGDEEGFYTTFFRGAEKIAGLYEMKGPEFEGVPPHWTTYVWVDDVDDAAAKAKGLGGRLLAEPFDIPDVGRMAVVMDPQGAVIQLYKGHEHEGTQVTDSSPGSFCWSELVTSDTNGAAGFYTELIGWKTVVEKMASGMIYTIFQNDDRGVGGMMKMEGEQWKGIPPHWMNYVSVVHVDKTAAAATALEGKVLVAPTDIPDIGRFAVIEDPTGAALSVITLATP